MIVLPVLLAAAETMPAIAPRERFAQCAALVKSDPAKAEEMANAWRNGGGNWPARQCLGLAYVAQEKWAAAAIAFEQAAADADLLHDGRAADLWVQAGNAALAGDDPGRGRVDLDRAIALPVLAGQMRGEALLDRARADVALNDPAAARTDLDQAIGLVPDDPAAWLLSATLARRQGETARAAKDIAEALRLAPGDVEVAYEAGNVAKLKGDEAGAKAEWTRATQIDPNDPAGQAAAAALAGKG